MQHINTKQSYNVNGNKILSARASGGCLVRLAWDYGLTENENHDLAAKKLVDKLDWGENEYIVSPTKNGFVYVNASERMVTL